MGQFDVQIKRELEPYLKDIEQLGNQAQLSVGRRAAIDTGRAIRTFADRLVRKKIRISKSSNMRRIKVTGGGTNENPQATITFEEPGSDKTQPSALSSGPYRELASGGISASTRVGQKPERWKHAFLIPNTKARDPDSAQELIVLRKYEDDKPTRKLTVLRRSNIVGQMMGQRSGEAPIADEVQEELGNVMEKKATDHIDRRIKRIRST